MRNPIQRLLGMADLHVRTAGRGGNGGNEGGSGKDEHHNRSLHLAVFRGVDDAREIRDLILERLKQIRTSGLGDPDEVSLEGVDSMAPQTASRASHELYDAIEAVRRETVAVRAAVRASAR
jgi:hypothetical protein